VTVRRIQELVARRTDLGTFLVHLTRETTQPADEQLKSILRSCIIEARSPFGQARQPLEKAGLSTDSQRCVCFTETPLELIHLLLGEIEQRSYQFEPYGVAITKKLGRHRGVNPVWYLDITPGHDWLTGPIDTLIHSEISAATFEGSPISKIAPFIEQMGSGAKAGGFGGYRKEFWWEREWRHVGNIFMPIRFLVICPEGRFAEFRAALAESGAAFHPQFIDAEWGLEQIIARLAGFSAAEVDIL
jgi:Putative abortive phage resistance protein AbiGi, antitoxin